MDGQTLSPDHMSMDPGIEMRGLFTAHDARITALGTRIGGLESRFSGVELKMENNTSLLNDIKTQIATSLAAANATQRASFGDLLSWIRDIVILVGFAASAIIYVAANSTSAEGTQAKINSAVMEYRLKMAETALADRHDGTWTPTRERPAK